MKYSDIVKQSIKVDFQKVIGFVLIVCIISAMIFMVYGFYDILIGKSYKNNARFCEAYCKDNNMEYVSGYANCRCYTYENKSFVGINRTVRTTHTFNLAVWE